MYKEFKKIINDNKKLNHLLFEDDNLFFLQYLEKEYFKKIDFIYIDPPYNTGKKFVYNDRKDNWNLFMKERLEIAYKLMKNGAFMFISIDDYSFCSLKFICDEIFKPKKNIVPFIRRTSSGGRNSSSYVSAVHDYVLVYQKIEEKTDKILISPNDNNTKYPLEDSRGVYKLRSLKRDNSNKNTNMNFNIKNPNDGKIYQCELGWRWGSKKVEWGIENDYIVFKNDSVYFKEYRDFNNEGNEIKRKTTIESILEDFPNSLGTNDLKNVLGINTCPFNNPKPVELIKYLINICNLEDNAIILDFFAGSGTTGQAVLELNKELDKDYQFLLCTNNEENICEEITYKRIENLLNGYKNLKGEDINKINENLIYYKKNT